MLVFALEGRNKTEKLYLQNLSRLSKTYIFKFASSKATDPKSLVNNIVSYVNEDKDLDFGVYKGFVLYDTDMNNSKLKNTEEAQKIAKKNKIKLIASNPCFEVWFLLHFVAFNRYCKNNEEVLFELKKYIVNYENNHDVYDLLENRTIQAIQNSKALKEFHKKNGTVNIFDMNPITFVDELLEHLDY